MRIFKDACCGAFESDTAVLDDIGSISNFKGLDDILFYDEYCSSGYKADIALLELTSDSFTPLNDLPRQLVYAETGNSVRHTIVNGAVVVRNGVVTTLDEQAIKAELRRLASTIRGYIAKIRSEAEKLIPYYREMYLKAMRTDVGMMRRLSDVDEEFGFG